MTIFENAGEGVATPTRGAPIVALLSGSAFGDTTTRLLQEAHVARRYRVPLPVAALVAELAFRNGGRR